jgi:FlaA1/EpsC-like NDP-sugar epimerase
MLLAAALVQDGILTPALHEQHSIADLARFLAEELAPGRMIPITFTQLRAGDREKERLWSPEESARSSSISGMLHITSPRIPCELLDDALSRMRRSVATRDRAAALDALSSLVPECALQGTTYPFRRSSSMRVAQ